MNGWVGRIQFGRGSYLDGNEGETWPVRPSISLDWISFFIFQITLVLWIEYQSLSSVYDSSLVVHLRKVSNALKCFLNNVFTAQLQPQVNFFFFKMMGMKKTPDLCVLLVLEVDVWPPRPPIHANVINDQLTDRPESQHTQRFTHILGSPFDGNILLIIASSFPLLSPSIQLSSTKSFCLVDGDSFGNRNN